MSVPPDWSSGYHELDKRLTVLERDISNKLSQLEKQNERIEAAIRERTAGAANPDHLYLMGRELISEIKGTSKGGMNPLLLVALGAAAAVIVVLFLQGGKPW